MQNSVKDLHPSHLESFPYTTAKAKTPTNFPSPVSIHKNFAMVASTYPERCFCSSHPHYVRATYQAETMGWSIHWKD